MQDSTIRLTVTAPGVEEATAKMEALGGVVESLKVNLNGSVTASGKSAKALNEEASAASNSANAVNRASKAHENYIFHIAKTTVLSAIVNKSFLGIQEAAGAAVKQVDLFANFPATMKAMGVSTADSTAALSKLRDYTAGIGGDLTEAATSVTRFTEVTRNVKASVAEFVGVKNALIAGGAGAEVQKNALEQLTQAYSRGVPQLVEWRSLMIAMPLQLSMVAKALNLPNANALGEALTAGKVNMQQFMTELTKLGTGTGPIAQQAIARMQGIEFATNVMKNALTNGLAAIYQAVGRQNIIVFFNFLTQIIMAASSGVVYFINLLINLFNMVSKVFGGPQYSNLAKDTGVAAGNTGDLANNLGDAADNAKDIKKSLASFDKMNVLPDKTDKSKGNKTTGPLDPSTAQALEGIFGNINGNLMKAGLAAKVFAGILAALAGNALINKLFGVDPLRGLIRGLGDAAKGSIGLLKNLKGVSGEAEKAGKQVGDSFGGKMVDGISGRAPQVEAGISGIFAGIGSKLAPLLAGAGLAIVGVIDTYILVPAITVIAGVAAVLGIPFEAAAAVIAIAVAAIVGIIWLIWKNWDKIWGFIKDAFNVTVDAMVAVWNTLYDTFKGPVEAVFNFIKSVFILIVALIAIALESIFKLVVASVTLVYNVLATIATWVFNNVIKPVGDFFTGLWNGIVAGVTAAWRWIFTNILAPIGGWIFNNVIQPILNFFTGLWNGVSGITVGFVNGIFNFLGPIGGWIYNNVIAPIGRFFQGLWDGVLNGLRAMWNGMQIILGNLVNIIKAPINAVIDAWNGLIGALNSISIPGTNIHPTFQRLPRLAQGGVVNQATLALVGEQGKEAVMPLENNTEWIDELASKINSANGRNGGQPIQLTVQIGEDKIATKVIELINEKTQMSGRNAIIV